MAERTLPLGLARKILRPEPPDPAKVRTRNRVILKYTLGVFLGVDAILGLMLVYTLFLKGPYLTLREVDVAGIKRLSQAEVIEAAELEGQINLLTVDLGAIAARLKRHPWIRSASVYRRFPGQLILEIEERSPRAILAAEKLYYVDEQADFFTRLLPGDSVEYPLFTGVAPDELKTRRSEVRDMVRVGLALMDVMERSGSGEEPGALAEIRINLDDGLSLQTRSGRLIVLGKGDYERKIQRYGRLKQYLTQRGEWPNARIINLDFEDRALVRSDKPHLQG